MHKLSIPEWLPRQTANLNSGLKSYLASLYNYMSNNSKQIHLYNKSVEDIEKNISSFRESLMNFRNKEVDKFCDQKQAIYLQRDK